MKTSILRVLVGVILFYGKVAASQTPKASLVPNLVRFSGTATASNGKALNRSVGITFALYQNQDGGSPLWLETQNVTPDRYGRYTVSLGVNKSQGVPLNLFKFWTSPVARGADRRPAGATACLALERALCAQGRRSGMGEHRAPAIKVLTLPEAFCLVSTRTQVSVRRRHAFELE